MSLSFSLKSITIPAKAGTHFRGNSHADEWVPAFAGMVVW